MGKVRKHGYMAQSIFLYGLEHLSEILLNQETKSWQFPVVFSLFEFYMFEK